MNTHIVKKVGRLCDHYVFGVPAVGPLGKIVARRITGIGSSKGAIAFLSNFV